MAAVAARTRPGIIQMTVIPLVESVRRSPRVVFGKIVGEASAPMLRHHKTVSVTERDHAPHREIGGRHGVAGFHRPEPVAASVGVGGAVRRLRVVMREVRLNGSHLHNIVRCFYVVFPVCKFETATLSTNTHRNR